MDIHLQPPPASIIPQLVRNIMASLHSMALFLFALGGNAALAMSSISSSSAAAPTGTSYPSGFNMKASWGNLSPYADSTGFDVPVGFPVECELSQVHVLHRHAQRYPTQWPLDGGWMERFAEKLANYSKKHPDTKVGKGALEFLNHWEYPLGENTLTPIGAATEAASGAEFWSQYGRLLYRAGPGDATWDKSLNVFSNGTARPKPTFRTTSYPRILESARWWLSKWNRYRELGAETDHTLSRWVLRQFRCQQLLLRVQVGCYPRRRQVQQHIVLH